MGLSTEPVAAGAGVLALGTAVTALAVHKGWISESDTQYVLGILAAVIALVGGVTRRKVTPTAVVDAAKQAVMVEGYELGQAHAKAKQAALFPPPVPGDRAGE
jgi:hypothetical protein